MELPDRSYAADVLNDVAVVACGDRSILAYTLRGGPVEQGRMKSPGESNTQVRSVALHQNRDLTSWLIAKTNGMVFDQSIFCCQRQNGVCQNEVGEVAE